MHKTDTTPNPRLPGYYWRAAAMVAVSALACTVLAHATLVLGTLEVTPDPPLPGAPLELRIRLEDPGLVAVEDALVRVEFRPLGEAVPGAGNATEAEVGPALAGSDPFRETDPGAYRARVTAPPAGTYTVTVRDTTFRQEEAIANVQLGIGPTAVGAVPFVLPPTATGPRSALTWVLWLVGVPLAAGILVTVLVLRSGPKAPNAQEPTA
ncbi:MAG: hypothetical protein R6W77_08410 [Trueperaceae bacterium]